MGSLSKGFGKFESLIFSVFFLFAGFFRFFILRKYLGDEVFRSVALWLPLFSFLPEFTNMLVDSSRKRRVSHYQLIFPLTVLLSLILIILLFFNLSKEIYILFFITIESLHFSELANRKKNLNWFLLLLRFLSIAVIIYLDALLFLFIIIFGLLLTYEKSTKINLLDYLSFIPSSKFLFSITFFSRLRDFIINKAIMQILYGNLFFYYFLASKILMNLAGLIYQTLRSSYHFDTTRLLSAVSSKINFTTFVLWIIFLIISVFCGFGQWIFLFILLLENLANQLVLFSNSNFLKILVSNFVGLLAGAVSFLILYFGILKPDFCWLILLAAISYNIKMFLSKT
jgi:hypothetical protein